MAITMPAARPIVPHFSSGPCAKRPGWSLQALTDAVLGRSHRSKIGKAKLKPARPCAGLGLTGAKAISATAVSSTPTVPEVVNRQVGPTVVAWPSLTVTYHS